MAATYDYQTGKVEHNYHFVRYGEKCRLSGLPAYTGSYRCLKCQHYGDSIHPFSTYISLGLRLDDSYVLCKHIEQKDSENCELAKRVFYEQLQNDALCALCH